MNLATPSKRDCNYSRYSHSFYLSFVSFHFLPSSFPACSHLLTNPSAALADNAPRSGFPPSVNTSRFHGGGILRLKLQSISDYLCSVELALILQPSSISFLPENLSPHLHHRENGFNSGTPTIATEEIDAVEFLRHGMHWKPYAIRTMEVCAPSFYS